MRKLLSVVVFAVNKFNVTNEVSIYAIATGMFASFTHQPPPHRHFYISDALSIDIAIIPESLIAVSTITIVVGMTAMCRRHVLIRNLNALEAFGGIICQ